MAKVIGIIAASVATTTVLALAVGGIFLYQAKAAEASDLRGERGQLMATRDTLSSQLAERERQLRATRAKLRRTSAALTKANKNRRAQRRELKRLRTELRKANERADANYSAGYSQGSASGYSSGRQDGLEAGSDDLTCSDDADVYWLPACNW